jgi:excisionase family DNA binding protein
VKENNQILQRRLFSIKEIASYLGRSPWSIAEMVRCGRLAYVPDGKRKFIDIKDVDIWIEKNKKQDVD